MSGSTVDVSSVPTTDLVEVTFGIQTILGVFEIGSMRGSATEWTSGQVLNGVGVILTSLTGTNDLSLTVAANDLTAGGALSIPGTFNCVVIIERT
jgi:hypothetical protein